MELFGLGAPELLLIVFLLLLFFGKDKLPDLARSIGTAFNELKKGFTDGAPADRKDEKGSATTTTTKT
jgi:sec-independent protein translocase protein TatA